MESRDKVVQLLKDIRSDDRRKKDEAACELWAYYLPSLLALSRQHLDKRLKQRADEEDVLQSMFKSFFRRQEKGQFDIEDRDELWRLLAMITVRKSRNLANRHRAEKRDYRRERRKEITADASGQWIEDLVSREPTASDAAILNEEYEARLRKLSSPELRGIALQKLEGLSNQEIADEHGCTVRNIERKMQKIRAEWESLQ
jgi:RNA polymerase sigma factor (sigma-70 family)